MFNFFVNNDKRNGNCFYIEGTDYNHIKNVLRMHENEEILVSCGGNGFLCRIAGFTGESVVAEILEENFVNTDLNIKIHLFQGLPKSDKMELIIQKAVELGADEIIPVQMNRCVVKLDDKKKSSKTARWQAIAESAAKQSKRTAIPTVSDPMSYKQAMQKAKELDLLLVPYENKDGMTATKEALSLIKNGMSVGILIGPEGGFEQSEIEAATAIGGKVISLGKRILRTETAAITAVGMCMLYCEMDLNGDDK